MIQLLHPLCNDILAGAPENREITSTQLKGIGHFLFELLTRGEFVQRLLPDLLSFFDHKFVTNFPRLKLINISRNEAICMKPKPTITKQFSFKTGDFPIDPHHAFDTRP